MEVGKLRTNSVPIFYFIIDPATPDTPNATRLKHYFVTTEVDSYVEAFYFLCRSLCSPPSDAAYRRWHNLYGKVFGSVTFDAFMKSVQSVPTKHFQLDTSEAAARSRLMEKKNDEPIASRQQESNLLVYPRADDAGDAMLELHRLRAELADTQSQLRLERSKQAVNGLADAERSALQYQLEQARQEAETERQRAREGSERLRSTITALEERLDRLAEQHDATLREQAADSHHRFVALEEQFIKREAEMQGKFEDAVRERDRRLNKAANRLRFLDGSMSELTAQLDLQKRENERLAQTATAATAERDSATEQAKRMRITIEALEIQLRDHQRHIQRIEDESRAKDDDMARLRAEALKYRHEAERFMHFTSTLHAELRELDDSSATAAEMLRRKVLRERQLNHAGGGGR